MIILTTDTELFVGEKTKDLERSKLKIRKLTKDLSKIVDEIIARVRYMRQLEYIKYSQNV